MTREAALPERARRWLWVFVVCRSGAIAAALGMLALHSSIGDDGLLGTLAAGWAIVTIVAVRLRPAVAGTPLAWAVDMAVAFALVVASGEWRSPFYLLAVTTLVLPSVQLAPRHALTLGVAFAAGYFGIGLGTGIDWEALGSTSRLESFTTHLLLPLLVGGLPIACVAPRRRPSRGAGAFRRAGSRSRAPADRMGAARLGEAARARRPARAQLAGVQR